MEPKEHVRLVASVAIEMIDEIFLPLLKAFAQEVLSGAYADKVPVEVQDVLSNAAHLTERELAHVRQDYFLGVHNFLEQNEEISLDTFHKYSPLISAVWQDIASRKPILGAIDFSLSTNRVAEIVEEVALEYPDLDCRGQSSNGEVFRSLTLKQRSGVFKFVVEVQIKAQPYMLVTPTVFVFAHSPRPMARFPLDLMFGDCRENLIFGIDDLEVRLRDVFFWALTFLDYCELRGVRA
ncbi:MAG: hypothetical protein BM560_20100 [Roseobacter sp. MedPE-SWde]|nr:MAG: hypothetical protein BM560_20100 [Roseobacter sp. MedPE-SWde]